ncbi:MAG: LytTR family DNA-binding domain-containing protein [Nonlabens ulvanivorans]|uniref:LytR/AlgR family response regulator transcription factor n=1 Tax=Nonlabens ulvanivorans TaxID=906888 RepID=UPI003265E428
MSLSIITIDDEKYIRDLLIDSLHNNFKHKITVEGEASSIKDGLALIKNVNPDIVLLDIELEDGNSFELLNQLETIDFELIFITGFDDKAIKAIKMGALDYLLKPIIESEFINAIEKAISAKSNKGQVAFLNQSNIAGDYYLKDIKENIVLKTIEAIHIVKIADIMYCKSDGNYTTFFLVNNKSILISKPIKYAVQLLPESNFVRCQRSYLVNANFVTQFIRSGSLILINGEELPVSGQNKDVVFERILQKMN